MQVWKQHRRVQMRRHVVAFFVSILCVFAVSTVSAIGTVTHAREISSRSSVPQAPHVNAKAAIVYDATSGQVLLDKSADVPLYPASTTKLMTAILLVKHTAPTDEIYVSKRATRQPKVRLGLTPGTTLSADEALRALLMKSANDVAYAVAESIGGSQEGFSRMMNVEARLLGCRNTSFVTPNGLHHLDHKTSAHDIAIILAEAVRYPRIVEAMQTKSATIAGKTIHNGNRLMYVHPTPFGTVIGGKTGFTSKAMYCLAFAVKQHGHVRISVVLGAPRKSLMYSETRRLLQWSNKVIPRN